MEQSDLRREMTRLRRSLSKEEVEARSAKIRKKLFSLTEFTNAETVAFYVSQEGSGEVYTHGMIRDALELGKRILVPVVSASSRNIVFSELFDVERDLEMGYFGILEPKPDLRKIVPVEKAELVIVPGVVFDERGNRIGRGGGYYDRLLSRSKRKVPKIALAYDFQVTKPMKVKSTDVKVDMIVTEAKIIHCSKQP